MSNGRQRGEWKCGSLVNNTGQFPLEKFRQKREMKNAQRTAKIKLVEKFVILNLIAQRQRNWDVVVVDGDVSLFVLKWSRGI